MNIKSFLSIGGNLYLLLTLFHWSHPTSVEAFLSPIPKITHENSSEVRKRKNENDYRRYHQIMTSRKGPNFLSSISSENNNEQIEGIYSLCCIDKIIDSNNQHGNWNDHEVFKDSRAFFAGTKRGKWMSFLIDDTKRPNSNDELETNSSNNKLSTVNNNSHIHHQQQLCRKIMISKPGKSIHNQDWKPYPIYSMMLWSDTQHHDEKRTQYLGCGGGDRYLTIWEEKSNSQGKEWEMIDKLGPHTGWVKDIVYDFKNQRIYSIGCNCIECWEEIDPFIGNSCNDKNHNRSSKKWRHMKKQIIESCPTTGATLSSDLLCLCLSDKMNSKYLFSGGVDGRIHVWATNTIKSNDNKTDSRLSPLTPLHTVRAHNGRVNKIAVCKRNNILFSVGHDGTIQCRNIHDGGMEDLSTFNKNDMILNDTADCELTFYDQTQEKMDRILTMTIIAQNDNNTIIAMGTSSGNVIKVHAKRKKKYILEMIVLNSLQLSDKPTVHTICKASKFVLKDDAYNHNERINVLVGHSNGLSMLSL